MITKKINKFIIGMAGCTLLAFTACSDMLETESTRQNIEPDITAKTDSMFYGFGILQAMQELADQYVLVGEMRGELVKTTNYTNNNLRQLADFSATTTNKYDSAYVYYRVINNCNYYIENRKTDLYRGSTNVVINEYAAVKAIRAWAYLQLGRIYERVPFFTEPLTKISQIDDNNFPEMTLAEMVTELAPDLEQYTGYDVPTYGLTSLNVGTPNWTSEKRISPKNCFIPVDVILGEMYLETGNYDAAARHYITYLTKVAPITSSPFIAPMTRKSAVSDRGAKLDNEGMPDVSQISVTIGSSPEWNGIFGANSTYDIISYIPMAVTRQNGKTTELPLIFGFDYYATPDERSNIGERHPYVEEIQLLPSDELWQLSDSTEYYYYTTPRQGQDEYDSISIAKCGDMRLRSILHKPTVVSDDNVNVRWIDTYKYGNIVLYRISTVLLHLAEAFNRLGMYDAAFAILKDGISSELTRVNSEGKYVVTYLSDETRRKLMTTYPMLSEENAYLFPGRLAIGIHCHGAGKAASDLAITTYKPGSSPYTLDRMAGLKMKEIAKTYGVNVGTTKQDTINAVEDMLCDEYALEFAFEGRRFYDLCRLARHKNTDTTYGANFGSIWLSKKLEKKSPVKDLTNEKNWYLPFK